MFTEEVNYYFFLRSTNRFVLPNPNFKASNYYDRVRFEWSTGLKVGESLMFDKSRHPDNL